MRGLVIGALLVSMSVAGALVACTDLFHATDDIQNACAFDVRVDGCASVDAAVADADADVADAAPATLCATSSAAAQVAAANACKWLGACEMPIGKNRYAACMVQALEAYDCSIRPNRAPKGLARDFWQCMASATSCAAVDRCASPRLQEPCFDAGDAAYAACAQPQDNNDIVRNYCPPGTRLAFAEPCFASGQICVSNLSNAHCGGGPLGSCTPGCTDAALHECDDAGGDIGVDCAAFGAQKCVTNGGASACLAEHGKSCAPTTAVSCSNGFATGCPSGIEETVDCRALTGSTTCNPSAPGPSWDVARVCFRPGTCNDDTCAGNQLTSCVDGATYTTKCDGPFTGCTTAPNIDGIGARCTLVDAGR